MTITDRDREYAVAAAKECNGLNDVVEAIAQAREEGRQEEREACAWTCERQRDCETDLGSTDCASRFATAIRARGEAS